MTTITQKYEEAKKYASIDVDTEAVLEKWLMSKFQCMCGKEMM